MDTLPEDLANSLGEEEDLILDHLDKEDDHFFSEWCLVGRFLTDQSINFNIMKNKMSELWKPVKGVAVKSLGGGRFFFQFFHRLNLKRVLEGSPWSFFNVPLILHYLKKGEHPLRVPLVRLPFWVQIYDLPHGFMSEKIGKQIGNFIGSFLEYDSSNNLVAWRNYMRIRVDVDVTLPLKWFKNIRRASGESFVVNFKYEKLNTFCFVCGRLSHTDKFCEVRFESNAEDMEKGGSS